MKKLLYTVLIAAMVLGFGTGAFGAAGDIAPPAFSDIAGHEAEGDLTLLGALGVFTGESGLGGVVKPNDSLTRAQFCKVVVTAMGRGSTALGLMGLRPTFSDEVPAWAWGYVNTAVFMGIINGYTDGTFGANKNVRYDETVTMLVRAVAGHKDLVPAGIWPYNFLFYAVDNDFTGSVDVGIASLPCTRGDMAQMMVATMQVDPFTGRPLAVDDEAAVLESHPGDNQNLFTGVFSVDSGAASGYAVGTHHLTFADPVYLLGAADYDAFRGNSVLVVENALGKAFFIQRTTGNIATGVFKKFGTDAGTTKDYIQLLDGTKTYYLLDTFAVNLNQVDLPAGNPAAVDPPYLLKYGDEVTLNLDKDGYLVQVFALRYDLVNADPYDDGYWDKVDKVEASKVVGTTKVNTKVTLYDDSAFGYDDDPTVGNAWTALDAKVFEIPKTAVVTINGAAAGRDDLKKNDIIKVATEGALGCLNATGLTIIAVAATRNVVEGNIVGKRTVYTDVTVDYYSIKVGETTTEYALDGTYTIGGSVGDHIKVLIDEATNIFFDLGFVSANPIVLLLGTSVQDFGGTVGLKYFVTVDEYGVEKTYQCTDIHAWDDFGNPGFSFYVLDISGATGKVDCAEYVSSPWSDHISWTALAIGEQSATLVEPNDDWTYYFTAPIAVYALKGTSSANAYFEYIGLGGLSDDPTDPDVVDIYEYDTGDPTSYWWLFVRDDNTGWDWSPIT